MKNWHEDDTFWIDMEKKLFTKEIWESAVDDIDHVLRLVSPTHDAEICDLCCGPGRHSLELAERGYRVTSVDRTAHYIESLKKEINRENLRIEPIMADMREFRRPGAFDITINLYTSFGYFDDQADDRKVLDNVYASLKPGGVFVIEMMGKEILARIFKERDWYEDDGVLYLEERTLSGDWSWIENRWIMITDKGRKEFSLSHRLFSGKELMDILKNSGFSKVTIYGSLEGIPYNQYARRLVALAVK